MAYTYDLRDYEKVPLKNGEVFEGRGYKIVAEEFDVHSYHKHFGRGLQFDMVYSDPPWNNSILSSFRNTLGKPKQDIEELLTHYCAVAAEGARKWVITYMGVQKAEFVEKKLVEYGVPHQTTFTMPYESGNAKLIIHSRNELFPEEYLSDTFWDFIGNNGLQVKSMFDPFIGAGRFNRELFKCGVHISGMEINPVKLSSLAVWLNKNQEK